MRSQVTSHKSQVKADKPDSKARGLTFIELVIVTSMLAVVGLALYATFSAGLRILKKTQAPIAEEDMAVFLDKFAVDVRNSHAVKPLLFHGTKETVEFPTLVAGREGGNRTIGKVIYLHENDLLKRQELDYSAAYTKRPERIKTISCPAKSAAFSYYLFDDEKKEYMWSDAYSGPALPRAVRLEFECDDGAETRTITKTVSVPVLE